MSETEITMPHPNQVLMEGNGLRRWSPVFDSLSVEDAGQGARVLRVAIGDATTEFHLTAKDASSLADILRPPAAAAYAPMPPMPNAVDFAVGGKRDLLLEIERLIDRKLQRFADRQRRSL
jgi:hypothetical protein